MSRQRIATWGPDGADLVHPGKPDVRVRAAAGCSPKKYRRDRPQEVVFATTAPKGHLHPEKFPERRVEPDRGSMRRWRVLPKGGPRNLLRIFAANRARHLITPRR